MMKKIILILLPLFALACTLTNAPSAETYSPPRDRVTASLTVATAMKAAQECQVKTGIDAGALNLRAGPGIQFDKLAILREGETVAILDGPPGAWQRIQTGDLIGWVNSSYLKCEDKP